MPYRYVLKWRRGYKESIIVEAWPKSKELALESERRKPSFVIGRLSGSRTIMLRELVEDTIRRYNSNVKGASIRVDFPKDDVQAIAVAFRIGLLAAILAEIQDRNSAENAYEYLMNATQEEIWFWASKMLGVIDRQPRKLNVIKALITLSSSRV